MKKGAAGREKRELSTSRPRPPLRLPSPTLVGACPSHQWRRHAGCDTSDGAAVRRPARRRHRPRRRERSLPVHGLSPTQRERLAQVPSGALGHGGSGLRRAPGLAGVLPGSVAKGISEGSPSRGARLVATPESFSAPGLRSTAVTMASSSEPAPGPRRWRRMLRAPRRQCPRAMHYRSG